MLTDFGIFAAYTSRRVLPAQWPMASISSIVTLQTGGVIKLSASKRQLKSYPISSIRAGIVRQARCSFFFNLIVVDSRNVVYIFRRVSGLQGFPTVLPNINFTYKVAVEIKQGHEPRITLPVARKRDKTSPIQKTCHRDLFGQIQSGGAKQELQLSTEGGCGAGGQSCSLAPVSGNFSM